MVRKLREADRLLAGGKDVTEVAKHLEISEQTYHRWRDQSLHDWCRFSGTETSYIEPGARRIPFVESFGSRLRHELLSVEQFDTLLEGQVMVGDCKRVLRLSRGALEAPANH